MSINLKRFVDINMVHHQSGISSGSRDTAALLTTETFTDSSSSATYIFSSLLDFTTRVSNYSTACPITYKYVKTFFDNKGVKLFIKPTVTDTAVGLKTAVLSLPDEYIVVAYTGTQSHIQSISTENDTNTIIELDNNNNVVYDIHSKILVAAVTSTSTIANTHRLAVKYTTINEDVMTIPAYLTKINVYGVDTVKDYCFTIEKVDEDSITDNDTVVGNCLANNLNVNINLANNDRVVGGNCTDEQDIVNEYMFITLQQTLTEKVLNALVTKIKGNNGLSVIKTVIVNELNNYVNNGYLDTTKLWTDEDYVYEGHVVIARNTPLITGYYVDIIPFSTITNTTTTPPIFVIIATSYGIRKVIINGDVI